MSAQRLRWPLIIWRWCAKKIIMQTLNLMHASMKDRYDAGVSVWQAPPIYEVLLVTIEKPLHLEYGRNRTGHSAVCFDPVKRIKHALDVALRLSLTPMLSRIQIDFVQSPRRSLLNANCEPQPGSLYQA